MNDNEYSNFYKIRMSAGGGMGGACWFEYILEDPSTIENNLSQFTRVDGRKIVLNKNYMVKAEYYSEPTHIDSRYFETKSCTAW
jgi:hypothetical protein